MTSVSRVIRAIAVVATVALSLPSLISATNFGSNTAAGGSPAHACDGSVNSQCVANNGTHTVEDIGLGSGWLTAVDVAIDNYDDDPSVSVAWSASSALDDVWAYSAGFGLNQLWGWTGCAITQSVTYGGSDPDRWCRPQVLRLNESYTQSASQKESIACHELGHTLGLRHSNEASGSCMKRDQRTILDFSDHDSIKLDQQY